MRQPVTTSAKRAGGERKPRAERWAQLIEVASEVFYEKGYEGASLQDIADRLGLLKGSLYYYIQSKEDLLYDVIREVHSDGLANITRRASGSGNVAERLGGVIVGHVEHICQNLVRTTVFLHELDSLTAERRREILGSEHAYQAVFRDLVAEGQRDGLFRADLDPKLAALTILGASNWVYRWWRPAGQFSPQQTGWQIADTSVRGLLVPSALAAWEDGPRPRLAPAPTPRVRAAPKPATAPKIRRSSARSA